MKKKFTIAILAALCLIVAGLTLGCSNKVKYYKLTYDNIDGIRYESEVFSGAEVKRGYTVRFKLDINYEKLEGETVVVKANDKELKADEEGYYSFAMTADTLVTVEGLFPISSYDVTFDAGEYRTRYLSADGGSELSSVNVRAGESLSFKVKQSAYYVGERKVLANTTVIEPDENGVYTFAVTGKTTVTIEGLEIDTPYRARQDGAGTLSNPFIISRPIDLYSMASEIADGFYTDAPYAYYKMTADIDMDGEQLYIIGDATTETSFFAGHFDGDGHTISNYFIDDEIVEQENFLSVFMPYQGLFGYVLSSENSPTEISNVHLKDFEMHVESNKAYSLTMVGGLVGYGIGVDIVGCSASGNITVEAHDNRFTYVGGIAGIVQSYYEGGVARPVAIRSCSSQVDIDCKSGLTYGAGGIVGFLRSLESRTPASVLGSYSTGNVSGAIYSGGIAGITTSYTSIGNCYSTGDVSAHSTVNIAIWNDKNEVESQYTMPAYAGGIAGGIGNDSIVYSSFACGKTNATAAIAGNAYHAAVTGQLAEENAYIEESPAYEYAVHSGANFGKGDWAKTALGWSEGDWVFASGKYPAINFEDTSVSYDITVNYVGGEVAANTVSAHDVYMPMSVWYNSGELDEFPIAGGKIGYGYYFEQTLTNKVPASYVPMGDVTLYAGLASHSDVVGTYYVRTSSPRENVYVDLAADGTLTYRDGARSYVSEYTYDGTHVWLYETPLAEHMNRNGFVTYNFRATVTGDEIRIDDYFSANSSGYNHVSGMKEIDGFGYGEYYRTDNPGLGYVFYRNGMGKAIGGSNELPFTYTVNGDSVTISGFSVPSSATLQDGVVTQVGTFTVSRYNAYHGVWENDGANRRFDFDADGTGTFTYEFYGYVSGAQTVIKSASGTYTVNADTGVATLAVTSGDADFNSATARFDGGFLSVNYTVGGVNVTEVYYGEHSYKGTWLFSQRIPVTLELGGISQSGYGKAKIDYEHYRYDLEYAADKSGTISLYYMTSPFGTLSLSKTDGTLTGEILSADDGNMTAAVFCLYDVFKGTWVSADSDLATVTFSGLGAYDLRGNETHLAVAGSVTVGEGTGAQSVKYSLGAGALSGSFTYNSVVYTFIYNYDGSVTVNPAAGDGIKLVRRDDWYGLTIISEDGATRFSFDGRGDIGSGSGTLSATATGGDWSANYTLEANGSVTFSGSHSGSVTVNSGVYTVVLDSANLNFYVDGGFDGEWYVGGTVDGEITIGKISPVSGGYRAVGTFMGNDVVYSYSRATGTLTFDWRGAEAEVTVHRDKEHTELSIKLGAVTHVCVSKDADYIDVYRGLYVTSDEKLFIRSFYFDGLLSSRSGGTAVVTEGYGSATETGTIAYAVDAYGHLVFKVKGSVVYVFMPAEGTSGQYVNSDAGKSYNLITPLMYDRTVYGEDEEGELDEEVKYRFDGVGNIFMDDNYTDVVYTYESVPQTDEDILALVYHFTFTRKSDGKKFDATVKYGDGIDLMTLTLTELK